MQFVFPNVIIVYTGYIHDLFIHHLYICVHTHSAEKHKGKKIENLENFSHIFIFIFLFLNIQVSPYTYYLIIFSYYQKNELRTIHQVSRWFCHMIFMYTLYFKSIIYHLCVLYLFL